MAISAGLSNPDTVMGYADKLFAYIGGKERFARIQRENVAVDEPRSTTFDDSFVDLKVTNIPINVRSRLDSKCP